MAKAKKIPAKFWTVRAAKIASAREENKADGMTERQRRQMVKDLRIAMGQTVSAAKYDLR